MTVDSYYSENDPFAAQWLRNLISAGQIAPGDVDERDMRDVRPDDLRGRTQLHFFAGVGGWYNRVGALRGFGNAIVPPLAAAFIRTYLDYRP